MAHVHITLVGGQPAPVYNGIIATMPDRIVFFYSDETRETAIRIAQEVKISSEQNRIDPVDLFDIENKVTKCALKYQNDVISVNISSGTKPWAFYFAKIFGQMRNATLFYVDQNNTLWNLSNKTATSITFNMDVQFKLLGNKLTHYIPFNRFTYEDAVVAKDLISAREYNFDNFNKLTTVLSKDWKKNYDNSNNGLFRLTPTNYVEWRKPDYVKLVLANKKNGVKEFVYNSPNSVHLTFNAGWFEFEVAKLISNWHYAKEIRVNCIFPPKKGIPKYPKNEIDIIIDTGTKILFVECKTQIANSTDIDKFRTAVKNYGGMGSKALFVTASTMTDLHKEKCKESSIIPYAFSSVRISPDEESELLDLLENELFNINTK